jgi:folate-dependent phosphoribosylglycinamide formyltransferase PurN
MLVTSENRVVLMGSGDVETGQGGSTIKEILRCSALGLIDVRIDAVVCNNSPNKVPGFYQNIEDHNREFGTHVKVHTINASRYPAAAGEVVAKGAQTLAEAQACVDLMDEACAKAYVQAGFMKKTVGALLEKIGLNGHPGPIENDQGFGLPGIDTKGLFGIHVQEKVIEEEYPYSGITIHEVTEDYDSGKIVAWYPVLVKPDDTPETLFVKVQIVEKSVTPGVIESYVHQLPGIQAA